MKKKAIFTLFSTALLLGSTGISSVSVFADELPKTAEPTQPAPAERKLKPLLLSAYCTSAPKIN